VTATGPRVTVFGPAVTVAVTNFVSALVEVSVAGVAGNWPLESVGPDEGVSVFAVPVTKRLTEAPETGWPLASRATTMIALLATPSAVIGPAAAESVDADGLGNLKKVAVALPFPLGLFAAFVSLTLMVFAPVLVDVMVMKLVVPSAESTPAAPFALVMVALPEAMLHWNVIPASAGTESVTVWPTVALCVGGLIVGVRVTGASVAVALAAGPVLFRLFFSRQVTVSVFGATGAVKALVLTVIEAAGNVPVAPLEIVPLVAEQL